MERNCKDKGSHTLSSNDVSDFGDSVRLDVTLEKIQVRRIGIISVGQRGGLIEGCHDQVCKCRTCRESRGLTDVGRDFHL